MKLETKFQDKNFELGEVVKAKVTTYYDENKVVVMADIARGGISRFEYNSIKDFTNHWEDAPEEPEEYWYIDYNGTVKRFQYLNYEWQNEMEAIGNYPFETKEEAELAVGKLKAFKRLKDKGFRFELWNYNGGNYQERIKTGRILFRVKDYEENDKDLDLLFGGGE